MNDPLNSNPSDALTAEVARRFADGELADHEADALRRQMEASPALARSLESAAAAERRLKLAVARVVTEARQPAPEALRAAVLMTLKQPIASESHVESTPDPVAGRINGSAAGSAAGSAPGRAPRFALPQRANFLAVAATLTLIAGVVLWGIFGRSIDDIPRTISPAELVAEAALFADEEHSRCRTEAGELDDRMTYRAPADAQRELSAWLGEPVEVFDLSAEGYTFRGGGRCAVPIGARSAQLAYVRLPSSSQPLAMASVFIVPLSTCRGGPCEGWERGRWYVSPVSTRCAHEVMQSTDGRMLYLLVSCDPDDLPDIVRAMKLGERSR